MCCCQTHIWLLSAPRTDKIVRLPATDCGGCWNNLSYSITPKVPRIVKHDQRPTPSRQLLQRIAQLLIPLDNVVSLLRIFRISLSSISDRHPSLLGCVSRIHDEIDICCADAFSRWQPSFLRWCRISSFWLKDDGVTLPPL